MQYNYYKIRVSKMSNQLIMLRIYTVLFLIYNSYLLVSDSIQTIFWLLFLHFFFFFSFLNDGVPNLDLLIMQYSALYFL